MTGLDALQTYMVPAQQMKPSTFLYWQLPWQQSASRSSENPFKQSEVWSKQTNSIGTYWLLIHHHRCLIVLLLLWPVRDN